MSKAGITPIHLIIPAAGKARRMDLDVPKPYLPLGGKTVLGQTIQRFLTMGQVASIQVAINPNDETLYQNAVKGFDCRPPLYGGATRQETIYNALKDGHYEDDDIILIHDAARPFIQPDKIIALVETVQKYGAATLAVKVPDTLLKENKTIDRDQMLAVQTPQGFRYDVIWQAHQKFKAHDGFTDDASLVRVLGYEVKNVTGSSKNFKITTQDDYHMAQALMNTLTETRTAMGFDVHAFCQDGENRPLVLGGLTIPDHKGLAGHSDADVVLHAVTDAILGGLNLGDIGTHFPPSDPQWTNADSALFLKHACDHLQDRQASLSFLDITLICESPKIGSYRETMQKRIADITGLEQSRISIKATTTEKLGFTGREEGIACQAVATLQIPRHNEA